MPLPSVFPLSPYSLNVSWEKPGDNEARGEVMGYSVNVITEQKVLPMFSQVLLLLAICFLCLLMYGSSKVVPIFMAMPNWNLPMEQCLDLLKYSEVSKLLWQTAQGGSDCLSALLSKGKNDFWKTVLKLSCPLWI